MTGGFGTIELLVNFLIYYEMFLICFLLYYSSFWDIMDLPIGLRNWLHHLSSSLLLMANSPPEWNI